MKLVSLFFFLGSFSAQAFTLNSSTNPDFEGWSDPEISFAINSSNCGGQDIEGLVNEALKIWNNVPTSKVKVKVSGSTTSTTAANPTTVYCETNFQAVTGANQNFVPAGAAVVPVGNNAVRGIFYINVSAGQANINNFDRDKLVIIMAHEIGHILGLGHSEDPAALMYFDASAKNTLSLAQDDIDGITYLYPRNEFFGKEKMMGCAGIHRVPPPSGGGWGALALLLLPLGFCFWLRKKANTFEA